MHQDMGWIRVARTDQSMTYLLILQLGTRRVEAGLQISHNRWDITDATVIAEIN
jgi:hypothetical protein